MLLFRYMKQNPLVRLSYFAFICIVFASCTHKNDFEVKDFHPLANLKKIQDTLFMDYEGAIQNGFVIPSVKQCDGGKFKFSFSIRNKSGKAKKFRYKIYYQNESYKFPEKKEGVLETQNPLAQENFYGSWEDVNKTFVSTADIAADDQFHSVEDSFRIVGNPRNEKRYYGPSEHIVITETKIQELLKYIKSDAKWYGQIKEKALKGNHPLDSQMRMDAMWVLKEEKLKDTFNNRWQRNPRVGKYGFMLVVSSEEESKDITPKYVSNISLKDGEDFINPFYYFQYGKGTRQNNIVALVSKDTLHVAARPDLASGIYIRDHYFKAEGRDTSAFNENCNASEKMFLQAPFEQYSHYIDPRFPLHNIPVVADVQGGEYTVTDYAKNASLTSLISTPVRNSDCPCKTVSSNPDHSMTMITPGTKDGEWRKENVGLISRNGFTYGKFRAKVKMPEMLNKSQLWNGLTNAIWLLSQGNNPWNYRRPSKHGYIPKEENDPLHPKRMENLGYSEIDFEMIKAAHYWPATSYHKGSKVPVETDADKDNIMVTYTNWDMANPDVKRFTMGADSISYQGDYFGIHRWDQFYKALSGKYAAKDDEIFGGKYFYFEIEWTPREIIWRIGPEKDKMKVVGYVNETISSIPNNQMLMVFTQEFHDAKWWPGSPFVQDRIPFPAKSILGNIYEVEIY